MDDSHSQRLPGKRLRDMQHEDLANIDPSLMTERQQLAFLLRQTASENPTSTSTDDDSGSEHDENVRRKLSSKKKTVKEVSSDSKNSDSKRAHLSSPTQTNDHSKSIDSKEKQKKTSDFKDRKTSSSFSSEHKEKKIKKTPEKKTVLKVKNEAIFSSDTSPSDVGSPLRSGNSKFKQFNVKKYISNTDEATSSSPLKKENSEKTTKKYANVEDSEYIGCAICGSSGSKEILFLCKKCDEKYPTQATLGKVPLSSS